MPHSAIVQMRAGCVVQCRVAKLHYQWSHDRVIVLNKYKYGPAAELVNISGTRLALTTIITTSVAATSSSRVLAVGFLALGVRSIDWPSRSFHFTDFLIECQVGSIHLLLLLVLLLGPRRALHCVLHARRVRRSL